jgi:trk system potassium uptake protein TrkA
MSRTVIVVGGGRVGRHTAEELVEQRSTVTVIERDAEKCATLADQQVGRVIEGDGTDEEVLREADPEAADVVAALTNDTRANVVVCEMAREIAPEIRTLARISQDGERDHQHRSEIDDIVYPAGVGARVAVDRIYGS